MGSRMPPRLSSVLPWPVPMAGARATSEELAESAPPPVSPALPPEWFHAHVATLWRIAARLGVRSAHVDDVLQEVFITAARRHAEVEAGKERAFLIATLVRLSLNHRRRAHLRHEVSEGEALDRRASTEPDAEGLLMRKQLRQRLDRALDSLSHEHRSVFVLYELEGLSVPEIAGLLQLPLGTAASRLGRARARFAEVAARLSKADDLPEDS
jgi:RNA polymerase sigma-70 factor, ECF subfamily